MKNPWFRLHDVANMLGLMLGALGIFLAGLEFNNLGITLTGVFSFLLFLFLFAINLYLLINNYQKLYLSMTRKLPFPFSYIRY